MGRKDTIIVSIIINIALLAILFSMAIHTELDFSTKKEDEKSLVSSEKT